MAAAGGRHAPAASHRRLPRWVGPAAWLHPCLHTHIAGLSAAVRQPCKSLVLGRRACLPACLPAEGIALLDLSSAGWRMLHCNDALRAAAGMPQLLAGATTRGSGGADEEGASAADFWSVFGHVSDGANGSHKVSQPTLAS